MHKKDAKLLRPGVEGALGSAQGRRVLYYSISHSTSIPIRTIRVRIKTVMVSSSR